MCLIMSPMSDILNPTFLMCLGIILISIACLVIYFENKLRHQNHKMSSMLGLVTSLTEEVNHTKKYLLHVTNNISHNSNVGFTNDQQLLIPVSDDDDDAGDDDSDSESDSDEDDDDDDGVEDAPNSLTPRLYDINKTKILKIDITPQHFLNTLYTENVDDENLEEINLISGSESGSESESDGDALNDSKLQDHSNTDFSNVKHDVDLSGAQLIDDIITTELKTIDITNLDDLVIVDVDYKKLSVPKLKILVGEKGLVADCSKMKKNDLLKLLEMS